MMQWRKRVCLVALFSLSCCTAAGAVDRAPDQFNVGANFEMPNGVYQGPLAMAGSAMDDTIELEVIGSELWSGFTSSGVSGNYAFVSLQHGLWVFDVSDPATPSVVADLHLNGGGRVRIQGSYAFVAARPSGLKVVDISDPLNPTLGAEYTPVNEDLRDLTISGNYAYLGDASGNIEIIDISNPLAPVQASVYDAGGIIRNISVVGGYAYVACYLHFQIIDVSDPSTPSFVGEYADPSYVFGVSVVGDYAYLACYSAVEVIDISDPYAPAFLDSLTMTENVSYISAHGDYVYAIGSSLIFRLDITNPASPISAGGGTCPPLTRELRFTGGYAWISSPWSFEIHETGLNGLMSVGSHGCYDELSDVSVWENTAYVANEYDGLQIVDVSDPANPTIITTYDEAQQALGVLARNDTAYVADGYYGLKILDVSTPAMPVLIGQCSPSGRLEKVAVQGDYAYVAALSEGMYIIDISDPTNPTVTGQYEGDPGYPSETYDLEVRSNYAYLGDWYGLIIVDVTDPAAPSFVSQPSGAQSAGVALSGNWAYVCTPTGGLKVIDISDPYAPVVDSFYTAWGRARDIVVDGNTGYMGGSDGVSVLDLSDPGHLSRLSVCKTPSGLFGIDYDGTHVYAAEFYGFEVLAAAASYQPGDINGDDIGPDISDLVYLVSYMFSGGPPPPVMEAADVDGSCSGPDIADLVYLVSYMFSGGPAPVACP